MPKRCNHGPKLPYLDAHYDAEDRLARGEKQVRCQECGLWVWEKEVGDSR